MNNQYFEGKTNYKYFKGNSLWFLEFLDGVNNEETMNHGVSICIPGSQPTSQSFHYQQISENFLANPTLILGTRLQLLTSIGTI